MDLSLVVVDRLHRLILLFGLVVVARPKFGLAAVFWRSGLDRFDHEVRVLRRGFGDRLVSWRIASIGSSAASFRDRVWSGLIAWIRVGAGF